MQKNEIYQLRWQLQNVLGVESIRQERFLKTKFIVVRWKIHWELDLELSKKNSLKIYVI